MIKGQYIRGESVNSVVYQMNKIPASWRDDSRITLKELIYLT